MGKRYLRSIVSDFQTLTASADITPVDLPVNPLSHLILTIEGTQTDPAVAGQYSMLGDYISGISDLSVRFKGENIIQGSGPDVYMLNACMTGFLPWKPKQADILGIVNAVSMMISFSRVPYWHEEAFPASTRGNLRFHMTAGALPAGFSARRWMLEAVELVEDTPTRYMKYTTNTRAIVATGRQRVPLPLGHEILGVLLFDPFTVSNLAREYRFSKVKILKDNVEQYFAESNYESLLEALGRRGLSAVELAGHVHRQQAAVPSNGEESQLVTTEAPQQYNYLDLDPLKDGSFSLETAGASTLDLDLNALVGAGSIRYLPLEMVPVAK